MTLFEPNGRSTLARFIYIVDVNGNDYIINVEYIETIEPNNNSHIIRMASGISYRATLSTKLIDDLIKEEVRAQAAQGS